MAHDVCPWWMGYLLASPIRKLFESPKELLSPHVKPGMRVLEPGSGMGFFTVELAHMVGPKGKVVALDLQERMLKGLERRVAKAGVGDRVETRLVNGHGLDISDLAGSIDFAAAINLVHEVPDQAGLFWDIYQSLKPGGILLFVEPKMHISGEEVAASLELARKTGFELVSREITRMGHLSILEKPV